MDANTIGNQSTEGSSINQHLGKHPNSLSDVIFILETKTMYSQELFHKASKSESKRKRKSSFTLYTSSKT